MIEISASTNQPSARTRRSRRSIPLPAALVMLFALFAVALLAPMPVLPNAARAQVVSTVSDRLPGWKIVRTRSSWEGAWTVVASCGPLQLGFQFVPGHGLSPGDAWLHPDDEYARDRLESISDDYRFIVWFRDPARPKALSCGQELARIGPGRARGMLD
jgi:hypothetical protein